MENELPFRVISAILFLVTWGVRKYYERQAGRIAEKGLLQDREGPYQWVRHPIYTAFIALGIGLFLLTESWMAGVPWLMSIGLALATRMDEEEAMMVEQFGESYKEYKVRTGRFLPRLRKSRNST